MPVTGQETESLTARRFRPYPEYKDTFIDWLGNIPAHWRVKRLKRIVEFRGGGTPTKDNIDFWHGDIPWVSPKDMKVSLIMDTEDKITCRAVRESATKRVPARAVLLVVRSGILVHSIPVAISGREVTLNQDLKALIPSSEILPEYLFFLIRGKQRELLVKWKKEGATVESLEIDLVAQTQLPLPDQSEQRSIASFLNRETAEVDALIAKKERLIELLQEKRTALITKAVTKGFDPNVPMKDSGIEWLAQIPAHWQVRRIAMAVDKITNGYVGPTRDILVKDGIRYLQSLHIKQGHIDFERGPYFVTEGWSQVHSKSILREGDVLVVQTGDIGQVAIVPEDFSGCNCHALIILRVKEGLALGAFLAVALQSHYGINILLWSQTGALHPHLECGHVREIRIAFPPKGEQAIILAELNSRLASLDKLIHKIGEAIFRLKEYRTALISAAVLGKIDVRQS